MNSPERFGHSLFCSPCRAECPRRGRPAYREDSAGRKKSAEGFPSCRIRSRPRKMPGSFPAGAVLSSGRSSLPEAGGIPYSGYFRQGFGIDS